MPFRPEFDHLYRDLIAPVLEAEGLGVSRADDPLHQRNILKGIIAGIDSAHLIVADITGLNPNVMYELGVAHALGRPVVMLTQNVEDAPFDLRGYTLTPYSASPANLD